MDQTTHQAGSSTAIQSWLTVERLGYGVALLIAIGLRWIALDEQPMTPGEAAQAWSALAPVSGAEVLPLPGVSPLLLSLQYLTFLLAEANEFWARFWPALAGTLLVLLPYGLRREIGRLAALLAAFLIAISTSLAFWSRSATGESLAYFAALAMAVCLVGVRRHAGREGTPLRWPSIAGWTAAAVAMLLMGAPVSYSALLALAPLAITLFWRGWSSLDGNPARRLLPKALAVFGVVLVLGSTAFLLYPAGLAALVDLPVTWLRQFVQSSGYSLGAILVQLVLEDAFLLVTGLAGLVIALRRRQPLAWSVGLWLAIALALIVRPGRSPADLGLVALPLALFGGQALALFAHQLTRLRDQPGEAAVLGLVSFALLGFMAIWLVDYAQSGIQEADRVFLLYVLLGAGLMLALFVFYAVWFGIGITLRVATAVLLLALLLPSLRAAAEMVQGSDGLRWGSLLQTTGAADARNIPAFLQQLARQDQPNGGDMRDLSVALVTPPGTQASPLLHWYLREAQVREVAGAGDATSDRVIVAPASAGATIGGAYTGRSYRTTQTWSPAGLTGGPLWRWLVYGTFPGPQAEERAVVWVRQAAD